jgi:outer membrane protein
MRSLALAVACALAAAAPLVALGQSAPTPPPFAPSVGARSAPESRGPRILGLDEVVRTARTSQPTLRQARASTEAAGARADQARAPLLPQLNGTASYERSTSNYTPRPGSLSASASSGTSWSTYGYWSFGAVLSQVVWDGGAAARWGAARASAAAQRESERSTGLDVVLAARSAFFSARAARDLVQVARDTLANQEAHLRQVEGNVEVGTRPEIDLAQARTDRANAQVQLITAENAYETAKSQLNQAMGVEGPTDYEIGDDVLPPVEGEDQQLDPLVAEALRARPDLAAIAESRRAQESTVNAARAGYLPVVGVQTGIADAGVEPIPNAVWNWNAQATLTWNLFDGGGTTAQVREARANLEGLDAQTAALRQSVRLQVDAGRLAVRSAKASLGAAGEALLNARERLRLAEGRYQAGAGSIIELGDAQVALTTAAAQRVKAEYDLSSARAQLLRALGRDAA